MISIDYKPTSWSRQERANTAGAINSAVTERYRLRKPLLIEEVLDVVDRLTRLIDATDASLEFQRDRILGN